MSSISALEFTSSSQTSLINSRKFKKSDIQHPSCTLPLTILTFLAAIGGFLFGYDTGVISSAAIFLRKQYSLTNFQIELIVSATVAAAALFSICAGYFNTLLGRKKTILVSSSLFIIGSAILASSFSFWFLILGRLVVGVAVGLSSTTVPTYLAEMAPVRARGTMLASFQLMITFGMWMASMIGAGFSYLGDDVGWRWMLGFAALPAVLQLLGFLFMPESPRWLVYRGRETQAFNVLVKINGKNDRRAFCLAAEELTNILKMKAKDNGTRRCSKIPMVKHTAHFRRALLLGCSLQLFQQLSGINTVMYYSATIIQMSGVSDDSLSIWLSSITSGVNFVATFLGMYLISKIRRRTLLLWSISGVIATLLLLSLSFFLISRVSISHFDGNATRFSNYSSNSHQNFCPSNLAWLSILSLALYLCSFAAGFGPLPWTICAEIFDNKSRSLGTSITTTVNWAANLIMSLTFLSLTQAISEQGAFLLYAGLSMAGLVVFYAFLPETKYHTLDDAEFLMTHTYSTFE